MDVSGNDTNIEPPKQSEDTVNYRVPNILSNNITNIDSFCPSIWDQPILNVVPHNLTQFPTDSAFIERAARFSCFNNGGSFSEMVNPFNVLDPLNPQMVTKYEVKNGVIGLSGNISNEGEFSRSGEREESIGLKKRKIIEKKIVHNENNEAPQICAEKTAEIRGNQESKHGCKNGKHEPKQDYIHVRARRGQATNSHSLAERLRREKISERMKLLQDLVPGCSKVTGKAVMLDEIINYVQSLQRQVEFLSMKLATVNPRMDFNIEGLVTKDILQQRTGLSSSMPFPHDMTIMPPPFQPTVSSQAPSVWDDEIHNVLHNSQDLSVSLPGHTKAEI